MCTPLFILKRGRVTNECSRGIDRNGTKKRLNSGIATVSKEIWST